MTERERFEVWARQRWAHPEDFDQRIKAPSKYNNYEVQAAWEAWQERAAQPATIEMSITTGALSEMFLRLDGHDKAQPGYEWRKGWNDAIRQAMDYAQPASSVPDGWKEAAIAWEVCASIHREYGKGKDPFFNTRQGDFVKHANAARAISALDTESKP